ncbi:hypothetical protein HGRIS_005546 [Hohenbuehelia grisea]|uniref:T6SS Phospholipase effector Tle1-like catalytic domain-containing protein n=1 Tax=Hohenbuehelia grisea TaxID=104357 RepID=A0ABR3JZF0_9AGAR
MSLPSTPAALNREAALPGLESTPPEGRSSDPTGTKLEPTPKPMESPHQAIESSIRRGNAPEAKADDQGVPSSGCMHKKDGRNLVVCIDGTANQFSKKNTNIVELYSNLEKTQTQLTYYNSGIGTYAKPAYFSLSYAVQRIDHTVDMMIAWNFKRIVLSAYQWLSENYQDGDCIFLFGFSRGAYQARVIAGMIKLVGLLHKGNNDQIAFAYELYTSITDSTNRTHQTIDQESKLLCARFKETLCRPNVKVHFVGAWDTVSSIGIVKGRSLPETTTGMRHVCAFRHALALDERRVKFLPEYANGGRGAKNTDKASTGDVKEVWFAGAHSDIGGGNVENIGLDKFGPALRWMTYEAISHGLKVKEYSPPTPASSRLTAGFRVHEGYDDDDDDSGDDSDAAPSRWWRKLSLRQHSSRPSKQSKATPTMAKEHGQGESYADGEHAQSLGVSSAPWSTISRPTESLTAVWWILEVFPGVKHLSYKSKDGTTFRPHFGRARRIQKGQKIHESVFEAMAAKPGSEVLPYMPRACLMGGLEWERDQTKLREEHTEKDPYASAGSLLNALKAIQKGSEDEPQAIINNDVLSRLNLTTSDTGLRSFTESPGSLETIISFLQSYEAPLDDHRVIEALFKVLAAFPKSRSYSYDILNSILARYPVSGARRILRRFVQWPFNGHAAAFLSVAVSPDGTRIASASGNYSICIWNTKTGEICGAPLMGHTNWVYSVAFSPDGTQLVSGSFDNTVRVWNVQTGQEAMAPLRGHTDTVCSVRFSPDGTRIVSGSADRTVRVWDAKTGATVMDPLKGPTGLVHSVAFSPDGRWIASGSWDDTIRIWNAETGGRALLSLEGHSDSVTSVAFSPDGTQIVSGSYDSTIRIWDAKTGQLVKALRGHSNWVLSVAYSPDGARIVSGSSDCSIRVWDAGSGEEIKKITGHATAVLSVAVTPDGERIVSGSGDTTIRVWDMTTGRQLLGPVDGWDDE